MIVLLCGAGVAQTGQAQAADSDLRRERGWLPYRFRVVATDAKGLAPARGWVTHILHADADGDGVDDFFRANGHGICGSPRSPAGRGSDWQTNLPAEFVRQGPCASVDGVWDIDGDGRREVVATAGTPDGYHWRLDVLDAVTGERRWTVDLPAGQDDRGDGNWDGFFRAFGPFTAHLATGPRKALLVGIEAGYDERPRGVMALDAHDGHELWRHLTGPKPVANCIHIVDLDGDGRQEICFVGAGVSNLEPGEEIDGAGDDQAMLFVLNDDGSLRWRRVLGNAPAGGCLKPVDLEGDGRTELAVGAFLTEAGQSALFLLDADGGLLVSQPLPSVCHSLAVATQAGAATAWLVIDDAVRRYALSRTAITPTSEAVLDGPASVALVADLVGDAALELVVGCSGGRNWLTDDALHPLALLKDRDYLALEGGAMVHRMADGARRLVLLGDPEHANAEFSLDTNPREVQWTLLVAGAATAGAAGAAWRWRRRKLTPAALRALRLQLLERLVGESHGQIGPLSAARRLVRFLASFPGQAGDRASSAQRIRELGREMLDAGVPQLVAAAEVAATAGLDQDAVTDAREDLGELQKSLASLLADWQEAAPADEDVIAAAATLRLQVEKTRTRFHRLRKLVEADFTASPSVILARSLAAHAERIAQLGVEVALPSEPVPDCVIDAGELAFVLDNVVENALRALEAAATRRLVVDWRPAGDLVALTVQDSGVGMTAAEAAAALEPGADKRAGGGRGLPGSCARLRKYEGKLAVAATAPGQGTTMVLYLRPFGSGAAQATPGGQA